MSLSGDNGALPPTAARFDTTHWSVVLAAGHPGSSGHSGASALGALCQAYWYPLYAFIRRQGSSPADAQDLTQAFFLRLIEGKLIASAVPGKGRFRSFLLASLRNFLSDQWDKSQAVKRGGGREVLSLDAADTEGRYLREPVEELDPERIFERRWALTVLEHALGRLEAEYRVLGKDALFRELHPVMLGEKSAVTYAQIGAKLKMTEGAVKVAAHRLHRRYREIIRTLIAQTVSQPGEIDEEIRHLLGVLTR